MLKTFLVVLSFVSLSLKAEELTKKEATEGYWSYTVLTGLILSSSLSNGWVGVTDGHSFTAGGTLNFTPTFKKKTHTWVSMFSLDENFSKTPAYSSFIKSYDELKLESKYKYGLPHSPFIGPFFKAGVTTALFAGNLILEQETPVSIEGGISSAPQSDISLTTPFGITSFNETLGVFWEAISDPTFNLEFSFGALVANQILANGQQKVVSQGTDLIALKELNSFYQLGSGLAFDVVGVFFEDKVTYKFSADITSPWWQSPKSVKSFTDSLISSIYVSATANIYEGLGLSWDFKAMKIPEIAEEFQLQNSFLLTFTYEG